PRTTRSTTTTMIARTATPATMSIHGLMPPDFCAPGWPAQLEYWLPGPPGAPHWPPGTPGAPPGGGGGTAPGAPPPHAGSWGWTARAPHGELCGVAGAAGWWLCCCQGDAPWPSEP